VSKHHPVHGINPLLPPLLELPRLTTGFMVGQKKLQQTLYLLK